MFTNIFHAFFGTLLLLVPVTLCGAAELVQPAAKDFRYIYSLKETPGASLYSLSIPLSVYQHSEQLGLKDLRVFDSQGVSMPLTISDVPEVIAAEERTYPALYVRVAEQGDKITLLGEPLSAYPPPTTTCADPKRREATAVLFDFSKNQRERITDLRLIPQISSQPAPDAPAAVQPSVQTGAVVSVRLFTSANMVQWHDRGLRTVGKITTEGQQIELLALDLTNREHYVLLLPEEGSSLFPVRGVAGKVQTRSQNMDTLREVSGQWDDKAGGYVYTVPPSLPVHTLSLALPGKTWLTNAEILTRGPSSRTGRKPRTEQTEKMAWHLCATGTFYSVTVDGTVHTSEPVPFTPSWLQVAEQPNLLLRPKGTKWEKAPELLLKYKEQDLYFLAAGPGPFRLAVGTSMPLTVSVDASIAKILKKQDASSTDVLTIQEQAVSSAAPQTGQKFFIWGALVLGALCMGGIALHILRTQKSTQKS